MTWVVGWCMGLKVRSRNCWICTEPALAPDGSGLEPFGVNAALAAVEHVRCQPLADLARRSVYRTRNDDRFGDERVAVLHIRTSGKWLLCKNDREREPKARVGALRDFGSVLRFGDRPDACVVCARELAGQVERIRERYGRARVVSQPPSSAP